MIRLTSWAGWSISFNVSARIVDVSLRCRHGTWRVLAVAALLDVSVSRDRHKHEAGVGVPAGVGSGIVVMPPHDVERSFALKRTGQSFRGSLWSGDSPWLSREPVVAPFVRAIPLLRLEAVSETLRRCFWLLGRPAKLARHLPRCPALA
jgi:hypothetical protein